MYAGLLSNADPDPANGSATDNTSEKSVPLEQIVKEVGKL